MQWVECKQWRSAGELPADYRELKLSGSTLVALVDAEDFARISRFTWGLRKDGYVQGGTARDGKNLRFLLHRYVMFGFPVVGPMLDHVNRNRLDCRKANLRICTPSQNQANSHRRFPKKTSRFRGVCQFRDRWRAAISGVGLGYFHDEEEAARAYDTAAAERFGEFATLNFPTVFNETPVVST